jgi:hypothetical protein
LPVGFIEIFVAVEPEDPVAAGVPQALIAGGGEAINPGEVEDAGAQRRRHLFGAVGGAGVDDDHLVDQVGGGTKAGGEVGLLVLDH